MKTIAVYNKLSEVRCWILVDDEDYMWLSQWKWSLDGRGYAKRGFTVGGRAGKKLTISMHRQIMGLKPGDKLEVDHFNGNKLDNRKENLRIVTTAENQQNVPSYRDSSSKYRGVTFHKQAGKWQSSIGLNGRHFYLGLFESEDKAGEVAAEFRKMHMPFSKEATS